MTCETSSLVESIITESRQNTSGLPLLCSFSAKLNPYFLNSTYSYLHTTFDFVKDDIGGVLHLNLRSSYEQRYF